MTMTNKDKKVQQFSFLMERSWQLNELCKKIRSQTNALRERNRVVNLPHEDEVYELFDKALSLYHAALTKLNRDIQHVKHGIPFPDKKITRNESARKLHKESASGFLRRKAREETD